MDTNSLIALVVIVVAVYVVFRLIISPLIKAAVGILVILIAIYILQTFFHFNFNNILGPYAKYTNLSTWGINANWIQTPIDYFMNQATPLFRSLMQNVPKTIKQ